jgi:hypothetical protein
VGCRKFGGARACCCSGPSHDLDQTRMIVCPKMLPKSASSVLKGKILPELKQGGLSGMQ